MIYLLNESFKIIGQLENISSYIWTTRYYSAGDCEICCPCTPEIVASIESAMFAARDIDFQSDGSIKNAMVIDSSSYNITTDSETGQETITINGNCLKSLLSRRVVWGQLTITGTPLYIINALIQQNLTNPKLALRTIDNVKIAYTDNKPCRITKMFKGDNLLDAVLNLCKRYGYGIRSLITADNYIQFEFFRGQDKSDKIFMSVANDNLTNTTYTSDKSNAANAAMVGGEGEGNKQRTASIGRKTGCARKEIYVDASSKTTNAENMTALAYNNILLQAGQDELGKRKEIRGIEAEAVDGVMYNYGEDYSLGDLVNVSDRYGHSIVTRTAEVIESYDDAGYVLVPSFAVDEIEDDDSNVEEVDGVTEEEPKEYDKNTSSWPSGTGSSSCGSGSGGPPKAVSGVLDSDTESIAAGVDLSSIVGVWLNGLKVTSSKYTVTKQTVTMTFTMSAGTEWEILYY